MKECYSGWEKKKTWIESREIKGGSRLSHPSHPAIPAAPVPPPVAKSKKKKKKAAA